MSIPLSLDPALHFEKLSNGVSVYVKENSKPSNTIEFRLVLRVGSVVEVRFTGDQSRNNS
jgi:predicted Zn-dependent peptidase